MHLPFTFTTGEAMLYHTGFPLHSFSEFAPGRAKKGSKTGKGREASPDTLHPKSLLGALMSQDESVYVCEPDGHSGLSNQWQTESECSSFFFGDNSLQVAPDQGSSQDPLLATLDSLSLDTEDPCSNTELFHALESLGLNAEDLELLLLDERMIQVELEPNHIPTLSDLLTNNEILSYVHNTLEDCPGGDMAPYGVNEDLPAVPASPPIIQQHVISGELARASPPPVELKGPSGPVLTPSQLNSELKHLLESSQQWSQDQHLVHYASHQQVQDPPLLGLHNQTTINGSYVPNSPASFLPSVEAGHTYGIAAAPRGPAALLSGLTAPDVCHYQSYQQQSSTVELEQLLGLSQAQHNLPAYNVFNSGPQGSAHSKVRPHPQLVRLYQ